MFKHSAALSISIVLIIVSVWAVVITGQKRYFPTGALDPNSPGSDDFANRWYSEQLEAMSEPVLKPVASSRAYRFTWLRTFNHPVAIRIVIAKGRCVLHATELDGAGGYAPGKIYRRKLEAIAPEGCTKVERLIQESGFWSLPPRGNIKGDDGSEWIVEGAASHYHVVSRWTPGSGPIRTIGEQFLSLTDWHYPAREMY